MSFNSLGIFFGMTPGGDTLNGDKEGISDGPDRWLAKTSFSILRSTTSGLCKADIKCWEWLEICWPSWWMEKTEIITWNKVLCNERSVPRQKETKWEVHFGCGLVTEGLGAWAGVLRLYYGHEKDKIFVDETLRIYNTNVCTDSWRIRHPYWI